MFSLFILPVVVMAPSRAADKLNVWNVCMDSDSLFLVVNQNRLDALRTWLVTYEELLAKQSEIGRPERRGIRAQTCRT